MNKLETVCSFSCNAGSVLDICDEKKAEPEDEALDLQFDLSSNTLLWS